MSGLTVILKKNSLVYSEYRHRHNMPLTVSWNSHFPIQIASEIVSIYDFERELPWIDFDIAGMSRGKKYESYYPGTFKVDTLEEEIRNLSQHEIPVNQFSLYSRLAFYVEPIRRFVGLKDTPSVQVICGIIFSDSFKPYDARELRGAVYVKSHDIERALDVHDKIVSMLNFNSN